MCGIVGFIGYDDCFKYIIHGLKMLRNRGYDSSGVSVLSSHITTEKFAGLDCLDKLDKLEHKFKNSSVGVGHNRWATHGAKTDENSHPHTDHTGRFCIVHNGIIENYNDIKKMLVNDKNIQFKSQTDTEVVVNLVSVLYDDVRCVETAFKQALDMLKGTWGLVLLCVDTPDKMYCARHGSPLLVGFTDNYAVIASEQSAFSKYVNNYVCLHDNDVITLEKSNNSILFDKSCYTVVETVGVDHPSTPYPYPHWTIKEIYEQESSILRAVGMGGRILSSTDVKLGGLSSHSEDLIDTEHLIILGCGTSYHAGLYCLSVFRQISGFSTVQLFDGAEFSCDDIPSTGNTCFIILSQSGETKDLFNCVEIGKNKGVTIGVVNVVDSYIAREVDCGVYLNAGREVGVASTKVFTSQVVVLHLIAVWFSQNRNVSKNKRSQIIKDLRNLHLDVKETLATTRDICKIVAEDIVASNSMFILGKGVSEAVAKEGSLKIKEISYIHAEGYSSSALKHGVYALCGHDTPVVMVAPDDKYLTKNISIIQELTSRDVNVVVISDIDIDNCGTVIVPSNKTFTPLLAVLVVQLISYEIAVIKGHDPDTPRNLAKSVTVD